MHDIQYKIGSLATHLSNTKYFNTAAGPKQFKATEILPSVGNLVENIDQTHISGPPQIYPLLYSISEIIVKYLLVLRDQEKY